MYTCQNHGNEKIVKNGLNTGDSQQYWCKDGVLEQKRGYAEAQKEQILFVMRGIQRAFGMSGPTPAS